MALLFPNHPDVVFRKAPLTSVLCQIRFPEILALVDKAGVAGFQEALRRDYPQFDVNLQAEVSMSEMHTEVRRKVPVWQLHDDNDKWQVSISVDFVALESKAYAHFGEFRDRLLAVMTVIERTLSPGRSKRLGLRKVNRLTHRDVKLPLDWRGLLKTELLGLSGAVGLPGQLGSDYAEFHLKDEDEGVLSIRHGVEHGSDGTYLLDLDYWTEKAMDIVPDDSFGTLLKGYSDSMTGFFYWCLMENLADYLEPIPRSEVAI